MKTADLLKSFVEKVTGIEVGGDEDVGLAGDGGIWELFGGDGRIDGGVELHFSVDGEV